VAVFFFLFGCVVFAAHWRKNNGNRWITWKTGKFLPVLPLGDLIAYTSFT
jgi:hypothetical protein